MTTEADTSATATPAADGAPPASAAPTSPEGGNILGDQPGAASPPTDISSPEATQPGTETKASDTPGC
ncbi:hypothetical protein CD178_02067 [Komagataeibacter saccharivorans]|uniref:Uncharacterized protein n=1 Tax=Komagataeibacter saccharivorans TaxID=265959 RepID=A0A347WD80_9PROT|nr:hypothetical protein [Komagataeibacter saccharivorans]AXY22823.1 hypothetical protein CD178_02067 [Komagataeibacter saccharivorans]